MESEAVFFFVALIDLDEDPPTNRMQSPRGQVWWFFVWDPWQAEPDRILGGGCSWRFLADHFLPNWRITWWIQMMIIPGSPVSPKQSGWSTWRIHGFRIPYHPTNGSNQPVWSLKWMDLPGVIGLANLRGVNLNPNCLDFFEFFWHPTKPIHLAKLIFFQCSTRTLEQNQAANRPYSILVVIRHRLDLWKDRLVGRSGGRKSASWEWFLVMLVWFPVCWAVKGWLLVPTFFFKADHHGTFSQVALILCVFFASTSSITHCTGCAQHHPR